jgi:hypothetical protein
MFSTLPHAIDRLGSPFNTNTRRRAPPPPRDCCQRSSSSTPLGGGEYRHFAHASPHVCHIVSYTICPPDPTPSPVYDGATAVVRDGMKDAYKAAMDTSVEAHTFKNYMKALNIKAVPALYISEFDESTMGYALASPEQMLSHLIHTYSRTNPRVLAANMDRIASVGICLYN